MKYYGFWAVHSERALTVVGILCYLNGAYHGVEQLDSPY